MSSERKNTGLRVALASYDVHQLRVWHQYIAEQSAEILCSEYRSGEELLQSLKQGRNTEVVVLGGPLEDMDSREFLERMSRLPQKRCFCCRTMPGGKEPLCPASRRTAPATSSARAV